MGKDNAPAGLIQFFRIDALFNAKVFAAALVVAKFEFIDIFNRALAADQAKQLITRHRRQIIVTNVAIDAIKVK